MSGIQTMIQNGRAALLRGFPRAKLLRSLLGVILLAAVMASAIAWRISGRADDPGVLAVFAWQTVVWLPWVGYYFAITYVVKRTGATQRVATSSVPIHVSAALVIALSHLAWYWQLSSYFSPLLGMRYTRFGVYPFFFIFWFLIDLLFYGVTVIVLHGKKLTQRTSTDDSYTEKFTVRKGRAQHIVRTTDIDWIEAQGYYAGMHTDSGVFLIRKSLNALENELDPAKFIRVHRSTIVNIEQVQKVRSAPGGAMSVILLSGDDRKVSRGGRQRLMNILKARS